VKSSIAFIVLTTALGSLLPVAIAQTLPTELQIRSNSGGVAPGETSDRTPARHSPTPDAQITTTPDGETSDRTPSNHGEHPPEVKSSNAATN
jgi:hypothetical protein